MRERERERETDIQRQRGRDREREEKREKHRRHDMLQGNDHSSISTESLMIFMTMSAMTWTTTMRMLVYTTMFM